MKRIKKIRMFVLFAFLLAALSFGLIKIGKPRLRIDAFSSEDNKYLYTVESFRAFNTSTKTLKKISLDTRKVIWRSRLAHTYSINYQALRELPALFFDETSVYYHIYNDDVQFLYSLKKDSGNLNFFADIGEQKENDDVQMSDSLYVQYIQLEDTIICLNQIRENEEYALQFSVVDKSSGSISRIVNTDSSIVSQPQGIRDSDADWFSMSYDWRYVRFYKKDDPAQSIVLDDVDGGGIQRGNMFYYLNVRNVFTEFDISGQTKRPLYKSDAIGESYWKMYGQDFMVAASRVDEKRSLVSLKNNGAQQWEYILPPGYIFSDMLAAEQTHYSPDRAAFFRLPNNTVPLYAYSYSTNAPNITVDGSKMFGMLDLKTGGVIWSTPLTEDTAEYFMPNDIYRSNNWYYAIIANKIIQINATTGQIEKSLKLLGRADEELLRYADYNMFNFHDQNVYIKIKESMVVQIDIANETYTVFGYKPFGTKFALEVETQGIITD